MSTQKLIRHSLILAFALTLAGVASARRPPALAESQEQAGRVLATCPQSQTRDAPGYRDMLAHVQTARPATRAIAEARLPPPRTMGDHLVFVCAGGEVHQGSGYRDFPMRSRAEPIRPEIGGTRRLVGHR